MLFTPFEIKETVDMFLRYKLDIRAITLGVSLLDCIGATGEATRKKIKEKLLKVAGNLVKTGYDIENIKRLGKVFSRSIVRYRVCPHGAAVAILELQRYGAEIKTLAN